MSGQAGGGAGSRWAQWAPPVLLASALLAGWWTKARCLVGGGGWTGGEQYLGWCYTDIYPLWFSERLHEGAIPYLDHPVEYPVLTGAQMWWADGVMRLLPGGASGVSFFHVTAVIGAVLLAWTLVSLRRAGASHQRLLRFALMPTLVVYAFMNWDPLAVALLTAALAAHLRDDDRLAGVFAGLGAAAKLFPGLLVPLVVATRLAQGRRSDALRHAGAAAVAWLAVNVPVLIAAPGGWLRFLDLNRERGADWDTLWLLAQRLRDRPFDTGALNLAVAATFLAGAALIAWLGARRRDPARWWELALPLLAWFLLSNKVYSPQFSLWLLPLLVLAPVPSAAVAAFGVADLAVFLVRFPYLGGADGLDPAPGYPLFAAVVLVRAVVLVWIIVAGTVGEPRAREPAGAPSGQTAAA